MTTVTVCCKLPNGLILRNFAMSTEEENIFGGGSRKVQRAKELPDRYVINGTAHPQNRAPAAAIQDSFALTPGVEKEFWDRWLSQNKGSDVVLNGLIFAHEKPSDLAAESKEKAALKSGLERLDPSNLPHPKLKTADRASATA